MILRTSSILLAACLPRHALAYDLGFVRAPDWMDPIVGALLVGFLVVWGVSIATKPEDVPVAEMYRSPMPALPTWAWRIAAGLFALLMGAVFLGMGLARM